MPPSPSRGSQCVGSQALIIALGHGPAAATARHNPRQAVTDRQLSAGITVGQNALESQHHRPDKLSRGRRTNRTVWQLADARSLFSTGAEQAKIRFDPGGEFVQAGAYAW